VPSLRDAIALLADVEYLTFQLQEECASDPRWRLALDLLQNAKSDPSHATVRGLHEQLIRALAWTRIIQAVPVCREFREAIYI
jgi:hypothetical protein